MQRRGSGLSGSNATHSPAPASLAFHATHITRLTLISQQTHCACRSLAMDCAGLVLVSAYTSDLGDSLEAASGYFSR